MTVAGAHRATPCGGCHGRGAGLVRDPAAAGACEACHPGRAGVLTGPMATRAAEAAFAAEAFGGLDPGFFGAQCSGCHLRACGDCHGGGHRLARPGAEDCHGCHRGYFVGADYLGRAPREDSLRYQRGEFVDGEAYLKMAPDVHREAGMTCGDCHSMASLARGERASQRCPDCHALDLKIQEHRIAAHREKLECSACHAAWGAQEYGTFFLRHEQSPSAQYFRVRHPSDRPYIKSAYLKLQDPPPLGLNGAGRVSPIRPQFTVYHTRVVDERPVGAENRLLAARWKAFVPHTVRRGAPLCGGCHENPRRFLLEPEADRIFLPREDGMTLGSFWDRSGQRVANGAFLPPERFAAMTRWSPEYARGAVERWKKLVGDGAAR